MTIKPGNRVRRLSHFAFEVPGVKCFQDPSDPARVGAIYTVQDVASVDGLNCEALRFREIPHHLGKWHNSALFEVVR